GGLVGFVAETAISNAYATGNVSGGTGDKVGGLVGYAGGVSSITNSYATGAVSGTLHFDGGSGSKYVGGLVGRAVGTLTNVWATGDVTGNAYVGGLVGNLSGQISYAYATGNVSAPGGGYV